MATLSVDGDEVVVEMSNLDKLEALHPTVRVPLASVREVRVVADPWPELRGIRSPGTGIPGKVAVGTRHGAGGTDFVVVHGKGPAVVLELTDTHYSRIVVTVEDPEEVAASIRQSASGGPE